MVLAIGQTTMNLETGRMASFRVHPGFGVR